MMLSAKIADMRTEFETHVFGPFQLTQALAPILKQNGGGAIVNINSAMSWIPGGSYGASKAALLSMTNALRLELAGQNTKVVSVHCGPIDTDMVRMLDLPKLSPTTVAQATLDGLENGDDEVLTEELSRQAKTLASGPVANYQLAV